MNRTELEDTILNARKYLEQYERIKTSCQLCSHNQMRNAEPFCTYHNAIVPKEYAAEPNECPEWDWDDIPF